MALQEGKGVTWSIAVEFKFFVLPDPRDDRRRTDVWIIADHRLAIFFCLHVFRSVSYYCDASETAAIEIAQFFSGNEIVG